MISLSKLPGSPLLETQNLIQFNATYVTDKKPVGAVLLKIAGLLALLALATAVITPPLIGWMPLWKAVLVMIGTVLIYLGASFIIRPQVDRDTLDWRLGSLTSDRAANINRLLAIAHWILAPGRFAAETLLDICTLIGLAERTQSSDDATTAAGTLLKPSAYSRASD